MDSADVVVVGGGFGGLGAALGLAEAGARVVLLERVGYLGGCASTFTHRGERYEAGATMLAGLGDGQLLRRVIDRYTLPVHTAPVDPVLELRWGDAPLEVPADRDALVTRLTSMPGAPVAALRSAFAHQGRAADALWALFDDPTLLPPWSPATLPRLLTRAPRLAPLLRWVGRPLREWIDAHGLAGFVPVERLFASVCQVTVQVGPDEAETPFALAAFDFLFRGICHVDGGIGALTAALGDALTALGTDVRLHAQATGLTRDGDRWVIHTRRGPITTPRVVANLAPHALRTFIGATPRLDALASRVEGGWGAVMSYRTVRADAVCGPRHLDLVRDPARPLVDGNHLLVSVSEPREGGICTVTTSTHVRLGNEGPAGIDRVQDELRATLGARAPEIVAATVSEFTASPRTFQRFTGRPGGWVGGIPRRAGLGAYAELWPRPVAERLWLVGDAVLMGQSTLATFISGLRTAEAVIRSSEG